MGPAQEITVKSMIKSYLDDGLSDEVILGYIRTFVQCTIGTNPIDDVYLLGLIRQVRAS